MTATAAVDHFVEAARAAGAVVSVLASGEDPQQAIRAVLLQEQANLVTLSPAAAARPWRADLAVRSTGARSIDSPFDADAGITTSDFALADTGTLVLLASSDQHRLDSLAPAVHIALLRATDLVGDLEELFARLVAANAFDSSSAITFIRGPSRTADIELTLSVGVHGPKRLHVIILA